MNSSYKIMLLVALIFFGFGVVYYVNNSAEDTKPSESSAPSNTINTQSSGNKNKLTATHTNTIKSSSLSTRKSNTLDRVRSMTGKSQKPSSYSTTQTPKTISQNRTAYKPIIPKKPIIKPNTSRTYTTKPPQTTQNTYTRRPPSLTLSSKPSNMMGTSTASTTTNSINKTSPNNHLNLSSSKLKPQTPSTFDKPAQFNHTTLNSRPQTNNTPTSYTRKPSSLFKKTHVPTTPKTKEYIVKPGDSLYKISKKVYGTVKYWKQLEKANSDIDPKRIKPGQKIKIPSLSSLQSKPAKKVNNSKPVANKSGNKTYAVQSGDTLSSISNKFYKTPNSWRVIFNANRKTMNDDPDSLQPGMTLVIPTKKK